MSQIETYCSPLSERYASPEMSRLFSSHTRILTWRKLWLVLAKCQHELGLPISEEQIEELEKHLEPIDFAKAADYEKHLRHDVMAHIHTWGDQCPKAKPIIHLGATSCYVTDNADLVITKQGLELIRNKLLQVIRNLAKFARHYADTPCLAYTHFQAAQPTTVGKRACLWLQDLLMDFDDISFRIKKLRFLGVKGATGTQASFLSLFDGNAEKVNTLDQRVCEAMNFSTTFPVTGQTYTRKQDIQVVDLLASFAATSHKIASDLRLLSHLKEVEEPFEAKQVGSSAMPYKRNPMRSERICSLARFLIALSENPKYTCAQQWLERTLDDSANRRLTLSEAFLTTDAILNLLINVTESLVVYPKMIEKHLLEELPFMATETILMHSVKKGADRQEVHERIRIHSQIAAQRIKEEGKENDLLKRLAEDPLIPLSHQEIATLVQAKDFIGLAPEQVESFLEGELAAVLHENQGIKPLQVSITV